VSTEHSVPPPPTIGPHGGAAYQAVTFALRPGFRPLLLDLAVPDGLAGPAPVVVWLHGGAFLSGDRRFLPDTLRPGSVPRALLAAGLATATIDYRLSGEARFPAQLNDVLTAWEYLHTYRERLNIDTGRLALWGESAGAMLAALAGLTVAADSAAPQAKAVACWYPPTDLRSPDLSPEATDSPEALLLGGAPATLPALATRASPVANVRAGAPPFLLVHGDADPFVPASQSRALHDALRKAGNDSTLRLVPGAGHCFTDCADPDSLIREAVAFLAERLAGTRT
jgi:acetyl esterase/lipase